MIRKDSGGDPFGREVAVQSRRAIVITTIAAAAITNLLSLLSGHLWVFPDSIDYVQLAVGIVRELDFSDELFLVRTPGYPLFLALVFAVFGAFSEGAILVLQHFFAAGTAVAAALLAWELFERRFPAMLTGVLTACSLQTLAYANLILTETPYTLVFILCAYSLVRFMKFGAPRHLGVASFLVGLGYLLRPVALALVGVCLLTVALHCLTQENRSHRPPLLWGLARGTLYAIVPALLVAAPWMALSTRAHQSLQATRCLDYVLYFRAVTMEGLSNGESPALEEIKDVVAEGRARGLIGSDADYRDRGAVMLAYERLYGKGFAYSSEKMGQAGRDLLLANPADVAIGTVKYAAWMLISPDPVYRFVPGGAAGKDGKRNRQAALYDLATYSRGPGSWEKELAAAGEFIALKNEPRLATPLWAGLCQAFYRHLESPRSWLGGRSLYELWCGLAAISAVWVLLVSPRRLPWAAVVAMVALHVGVSAFLGGPQTRYAAPVKPLMILLFPAFPLWVADLVRSERRFQRNNISKTPVNRFTSAAVKA